MHRVGFRRTSVDVNTKEGSWTVMSVRPPIGCLHAPFFLKINIFGACSQSGPDFHSVLDVKTLRSSNSLCVTNHGKEKKLGAYAIKRVAAGAHLPIPWLFESGKSPDDRADYCLGYRFLP